MNKLNIVFPAAGKSQRFKDVGVLTPKPLIKVYGISLLHWAISNFSMNSIDRIFAITLKQDQVKNYFVENFPKLANQINFIEIDSITSGPAATVLHALKHIDSQESVVIANTDQYIFSDLTDFLDLVRRKVTDGQLLTMGAEGNQWSFVARNELGNISRVAEKIQISNEATVGVYAFSKNEDLERAIRKMMEQGGSINGEYYVAPTYNYLIEENKLINASYIGEFRNAMQSTGTPGDLKSFMSDPRTEIISRKILSNYNLM